MNKILLYLAFIFSISPAYAEWVKYSTTDDSEIEIYLDPNTIRRNGNSVLIWTLQDFKKVRNGDLSMKLRVKIECKEETVQIISLVSHSENMGKGKITVSGRGSGKPQYVVPDSSGEELWKLACNRK
jgi:hypothetical protein